MAGKECKERNDKAKLEYVYSLHQRLLFEFLTPYLHRELKKKAPNSMVARELDLVATSMK